MTKKTDNLIEFVCIFCKFSENGTIAGIKNAGTIAFKLISSGGALKLLIVSLVLALITSLVFSLSHAGCLLVAIAIAAAGLQRFFSSIIEYFENSTQEQKEIFNGQMESIEEKTNRNRTFILSFLESENLKPNFDEIDSNIVNLRDKVNSLGLVLVEFINAFVGTLLWGFG